MTPLEIWFFNLPPLVSISIVGILITLFTSLRYKFVTDQKLMKTLKTELKDLQNAMKQHKESPEQLMKIQQKAMEKNMEYMKHSMRPTLFTAIPLILLFGWLNAHIAYYPIVQDVPFDVMAEFKDVADAQATLSVTPSQGIEFLSQPTQEIGDDNEVEWELRGREGEYTLEYTYEDETKTQELLIVPDESYREYKTPFLKVKGAYFKSLQIENKKVMPLEFLGIEWGWIGPYIIISILFSTIIRKLLKIS